VTSGRVAAGSFSWQIAPPKETRVVVVKTTLALVADGAAVPCPEQDPLSGDVLHDRDHRADGPEPSVRYPSDFAPFKPRADVLVVGHAHPSTPGAGVVSVQVVFGALHRAIAVVGDRTWSGGAPTAPAPLTPMPLRYERAFGGAGYDPNPLGVGLGGALLPNLELPERLLRGKGDRPAPACFAPVPATFRARASRLGRYDAAWLRERWPYFPADFDWGYFNSAPAEQQIPYPRGDEPFSLSGLHPTVPVLRGRLPGLAPRAYAVLSAEHALREIPLRLDTLWFDADAQRVVLVWRGMQEVSAEHAPEIAALFVCDGLLGAPADLPRAAARLDAELVALHGPPPAPAPAPVSGDVGAAEPGAFAAAPVTAPPAKLRAEVMAMLASGASLDGADLSRCDLSGLDLRGKKLMRALLSTAVLDGALFDGADLAGAVLAGARGRGASFEGASLRGANLAGAALVEANLAGAVLEDASLVDADLSAAVLRGALLARANLCDARLPGAALDGASAPAADLSGAVLDGASFRGAVLDDAQIYGSAASGCCFDGASMARFRADDAQLSKSTFAQAKASSASFESADLRGAVFQAAELEGAVFNHADLSGASLNRVSAKGARFRHARLARASALKANLMEANFEGADLGGADLRGANLYAVETLKATLDGAQLDQAILAGSKLV
jgi:uncharacterized protein YjbI with pentapeptide repeats